MQVTVKLERLNFNRFHAFFNPANIEVGYAPRTFSDLIHRKKLKMVRGAYPTLFLQLVSVTRMLTKHSASWYISQQLAQPEIQPFLTKF